MFCPEPKIGSRTYFSNIAVMENKIELVIYVDAGHEGPIEVILKDESIWLTQKQIADLFGTKIPAISKHIKNILIDNELRIESTVSKMEIVQREGKRLISRSTEVYNLDMVLSIGYRVNSVKATQFRIWASRILKDHLINGYSINERRLKDQSSVRLLELQKTVAFIKSVAEKRQLSADEASGLLQVIADYTLALNILDEYDHEQLLPGTGSRPELFRITYPAAVKAIVRLRKYFSSSTFFGLEKDHSFQSSLNTIYQTFGNHELYKTLEDKAAHLLYFVIKNHSFVDGNKRIGAFLFVWFLERNGLLYRNNGSKRIADNALVALTILIAESNPAHKDIMVRLVINLINERHD